MIVAGKFVFIHLHRTGGQFVRRLLLTYCEDANEIGYHFPLHMLPSRYQHLPIIGFVRNPWDWYVSWYAFNRIRPRSPVFTVASANGTLGFSETVHNMLHLGSSEARHRQLKSKMVDALPRSIIGNRGIGIARDELAAFNNENEGYYSWLVRRMYGDTATARQIQLGKFENLRGDLHDILDQLNIKPAPAFMQQLHHGEKINATVHHQYCRYYDTALKNVVASREQALLQQHGYLFEDTTATPD